MQPPCIAQGRPPDPELSLLIPHGKVIGERETNKVKYARKNDSIKDKDKAVKISSYGGNRNAQLDKTITEGQTGSFVWMRNK